MGLADGPKPRLLDLGLAEFDVLARNRVVLLHHQLVGLGARVLLGDVIKAGVGGGHELDLDGGGFGHGNTLGGAIELARTLGLAPRMSSKRARVRVVAAAAFLAFGAASASTAADRVVVNPRS